MDFKKAFLIISILDILLICLLSAVSFRFLLSQWQKTKELKPEIMAQYNISLEQELLKKILIDLEKGSTP